MRLIFLKDDLDMSDGIMSVRKRSSRLPSTTRTPKPSSHRLPYPIRLLCRRVLSMR